jgi:L-methionine (R)-S-oxide reductase
MDKEYKYKQLLPEIAALIDPKIDLIGNMSNVAAALHGHLKMHWTGFYRVLNNELVLGPFQGPVACTRIALGKGVCGTSWKTKDTIIVENVHVFPGHIACSALSNSEIVVPLIIDNQVIAVLDIDSTQFNDFDEVDKMYLEKIVSFLAN